MKSENMDIQGQGEISIDLKNLDLGRLKLKKGETKKITIDAKQAMLQILSMIERHLESIDKCLANIEAKQSKCGYISDGEPPRFSHSNNWGILQR